LHAAHEIEVLVKNLSGFVVRKPVGELECSEPCLDRFGVVMSAGISVVIFIFGAVVICALAGALVIIAPPATTDAASKALPPNRRSRRSIPSLSVEGLFKPFFS
jgi:hypothetical protein